MANEASSLETVKTHEGMEAFFNKFDELSGGSTEQPRHDLIPKDIRNKTGAIALKVDGFHTIRSLKQLCNDHSLELKGDDVAQQGYYARLHKLPPLTEGGKPGVLVFAIIPPGHRAPAHIHKGQQEGYGELTITLAGELEYLDKNGEILTHTSEDLPRISLAESADVYLPNTNDKPWVGFYVQPAPCELIENEAVRRIAAGYGIVAETIKAISDAVQDLAKKLTSK